MTMKKGALIGGFALGLATGVFLEYFHNMSVEIDKIIDEMDNETLADTDEEEPADFKED